MASRTRLNPTQRIDRLLDNYKRVTTLGGLQKIEAEIQRLQVIREAAQKQQLHQEIARRRKNGLLPSYGLSTRDIELKAGAIRAEKKSVQFGAILRGKGVLAAKQALLAFGENEVNSEVCKANQPK